MERTERVLLAVAAGATAARAAQRVAAGGGEAIIITSVAEARGITGAFDRGIFAFDLPDGSGILLAAEMMMNARLSGIEFFHPAEELVARAGHEMRSTSGAIDPEQITCSAA